MIVLTIAVLLTIPAIASTADVPDFIHICKRNDPDLSGCISESIKHIQPYLTNGIPEFNIPALEPLVLEELVAVEGAGIKISGRKINAYGCSATTTSNLKADLEKMTVSADVTIPNLYVTGEYYMDGKILMLSLTGSGPMEGNFTDCSGSVTMQGELRKSESGEEHLYCTDFNVKFVVGQGSIHFGNLFGGDRSLGDAVNTAINSNFDLFIRELRPLVEKALALALKDIANNIVKPFTFAQLLPES